MLLAISTSTEALSVALWDDGRLLGAYREVIGRGHAERLLPVVAEVMGERRAGRLAVDCGPGSFTGVRVGIAAARGLGIAWKAPVAGFSSLVLMAAAVAAPGPFAIANRAGHGEVFWQMFQPNPLRSIGPARSVRPEEAARLGGNVPVWGTGAELVSPGDAARAFPDARRFDALPADALGLPLRPIYLRAPDARPRTP